MPVDSIAVAMHASTSPSEIKRIRAPAARTSLIRSAWRGRSRMMTQTSLIGLSSALATASRFSRTGASMCTYGAAFGPTASFFMYVSGACSRPPRSAIAITAIALGKPVGHEVGPLDGIDGDVDLFTAAADFLADVEHRRLVALAFADDDAAGDLHLAERFAHLLDGSAVGGVALAAPHPTRCRERRAFGDLHEIERVNRMVQHRPHHRPCHCSRAYKGKRLISC